MIEARPTSANMTVVDLVQLGIKMNEKQICWQDSELNDIFECVCDKLQHLHQAYKLHGVTNMLMTTSGGIYLLGVFKPITRH